MSLTSYRAAPPRGDVFLSCRELFFVGLSGLAATYSPASWDAVPSARRCLTAEFGMGSGVSLALGPPNLESPRPAAAFAAPGGIHETVFRSTHWVFDFLPGRVCRLPDRMKPIGRLVPVS